MPHITSAILENKGFARGSGLFRPPTCLRRFDYGLRNGPVVSRLPVFLNRQSSVAVRATQTLQAFTFERLRQATGD